MCEHKEVLFVPTGTMTQKEKPTDGVRLMFTEPKFICVACKEYVSRPTDRRRIVNVPEYDPDKCEHPDKVYTLGSCYFCLNCGSTWSPFPPKLDIKTNPNWEEEDKRFREEEVEKWLEGSQQGATQKLSHSG